MIRVRGIVIALFMLDVGKAGAQDIDGRACLKENAQFGQNVIDCMIRIRSLKGEEADVLRITMNIFSAYNCQAHLSLPRSYIDPAYLRQADELEIDRTKFECHLVTASGQSYERVVYAGMACHRAGSKMICTPDVLLDGQVGILGPILKRLSNPFELPDDFPSIVEAYEKQWK
jgi:hypothetical protein